MRCMVFTRSWKGAFVDAPDYKLWFNVFSWFAVMVNFQWASTQFLNFDGHFLAYNRNNMTNLQLCTWIISIFICFQRSNMNSISLNVAWKSTAYFMLPFMKISRNYVRFECKIACNRCDLCDGVFIVSIFCRRANRNPNESINDLRRCCMLAKKKNNKTLQTQHQPKCGESMAKILPKRIMMHELLLNLSIKYFQNDVLLPLKMCRSLCEPRVYL